MKTPETNAALDTLLEIAQQMRQAEGLIGQNQSGPPTQGVQRQIVADLEQLIRQAQGRSSANQSSSSQRQQTDSQQPGQQTPKPGQGQPKPGPARDSNTTAGKGQPQRASREQMKVILTQIWGELPETTRQQMLELWSEEFLPKYELLIEEYFKRLAEEKGQ